MKITFLGTKGEIEQDNPKHEMHSSILVEYKNTRLLVDFGETWKCKLEEVNPTHIALTHAHPDHAWGLDKPVDVPVYMREVVRDTLKPSILENIRNREIIVRDHWYKVGDLRILALPVTHSLKCPTNGFLISDGRDTIGYFPDVLHIPNYRVALRNIDILIGDGSYITDKPGRVRHDEAGRPYGHCRIRDIVRMAANIGARAAIITHFGEEAVKNPQKLKEHLEELSKEYNIPVIEAYDGMTIDTRDLFGLRELAGDESFAVLPGIYLVPPHARLIAEGKKTLIVKTRRFDKYIGRPLYLVEDNLIYGIITLKSVLGPFKEKDVREKLRERHRISDKEWDKWWKGHDEFYIYEFDVDYLFPEPVPYEPPKGVQTFIRKVVVPTELEEVRFATMTPLQRLKKLWKELNRKLDVKDFEDERWLNDPEWYGKDVCPTPEHEWLMALSWGPHVPERQLQVYWNARREFDRMKKHFHEMNDDDIERLGFPFEFQNKFMKRLVDWLKANDMTFDQLYLYLKNMPGTEGIVLLKHILETDDDKIIGCFLRDYVRRAAFPIDRHVRRKLERIGLPTDQLTMIVLCKLAGICSSVLNRMLVGAD